MTRAAILAACLALAACEPADWSAYEVAGAQCIQSGNSMVECIAMCRALTDPLNRYQPREACGAAAAKAVLQTPG